jgi:hypothetical protein
MGIRYTVYLRRSAAHVTPAELLAGTRIADLYTIAEFSDVPDAMIRDALGQLRIENVDHAGFRFYRLCYRPDGMRQVEVERWQTPAEVRADAAEVLELVTARNHPALGRIRDHLHGTVDIVSASFGSAPGERMAPVLASEVTRWLAEEFDGLVRDADDSWWELGQYKEYVRLVP